MFPFFRKYTNVHRNEQPVDVEDAILFWINKICATVRDNLGYGKVRSVWASGLDWIG